MDINDISNVTGVAESIGNLGFMVVTAAFFLVLSALLMVACFRWFKNIINNMLSGNQKMVSDLLEETRNQNLMLSDLTEALKPETQLRIKQTTGAYLDLAVERVCRLILQVRKENHIADREATQRKVHTLLQNLHDDRKSKLDSYTYRGQKVSTYVNSEWVSWVELVFIQEVYREGFSESLARANVESIYGRIKLDLYQRMNGI
ncbi:MAG: hypothetical protein IKH89_05150 [Bacteroidales bacterium]|nr:hypothetical protein [Bacteroidales bacterium]